MTWCPFVLKYTFIQGHGTITLITEVVRTLEGFAAMSAYLQVPRGPGAERGVQAAFSLVAVMGSLVLCPAPCPVLL